MDIRNIPLSIKCFFINVFTKHLIYDYYNDKGVRITIKMLKANKDLIRGKLEEDEELYNHVIVDDPEGDINIEDKEWLGRYYKSIKGKS